MKFTWRKDLPDHAGRNWARVEEAQLGEYTDTVYWKQTRYRQSGTCSLLRMIENSFWNMWTRPWQGSTYSSYVIAVYGEMLMGTHELTSARIDMCVRHT